MADARAARGRLDTPRELRRPLFKKPTLRDDVFGSFAEGFARYMGTARFIAWMTMVVLIWVAWNTLAPLEWRFDEFPFIFLTLALSLQASYAAPLILLAQNRQEDRDRVLAEQDRRIAAQSKADMEFLARETASLRMALGEVATRDYLRSELRLLLEELDERDRHRGLIDQTSGDAGESPRTT
ncbi:DUF1003 domain-containing protein [Nocardioides sp. NPDC057767]|uniref:DUF1003 domain-containing protein n=1 Tax=unclassified Nocardioides TaxID=2615069 RepID=UPI0036723CEC